MDVNASQTDHIYFC